MVAGWFTGTIRVGEVTLHAGTLDGRCSSGIFVGRLGPDGGWEFLTGLSFRNYSTKVLQILPGKAGIYSLVIADIESPESWPNLGRIDAVEVLNFSDDGRISPVLRIPIVYGSDDAEISISSVTTGDDGSMVAIGLVNGTVSVGDAALVGDTRYVQDMFGELRAEPDAFVAKIRSDGRVAWVQRITTGRLFQWGGAVILADGSVAIGGAHGGSTSFGLRTLRSSLPDIVDGFLARLTPDGEWTWVQALAGANSQDEILGLAAAPDESVMVVGINGRNTTIGQRVYSSPDGRDLFVTKVRRGGSVAWVATTTGPGVAYAWAITASRGGTVLIGGYFNRRWTVGTGTYMSRGREPEMTTIPDVFVARLSPEGRWG